MIQGAGPPNPVPPEFFETLPDSVAHQHFVRYLPAAWWPYLQLARIDRPIGWWLLLLPCWWAAALAGIAIGRGPDIGDLILFLIGAIAMRGAGSTYNDIIDRAIDAKVERTRGRPLPSGRVSVTAAKAFFLAQCLVGLAVLLSFNGFSILLGFASMLVVGLYPFAKRVTSWPQAVLGLAFSWGGLMGWAVRFGTLQGPAVLVYAAAFFWTIGYDTIYALQDIRDDRRAGVKSTARLFGRRLRPAVATFYAAAVLCLEAALLLVRPDGLWAQAGIIGFALHLAGQLARMRPDDPERALMLFRSNRDAGLILFAGFAAEGLRLALG